MFFINYVIYLIVPKINIKLIFKRGMQLKLIIENRTNGNGNSHSSRQKASMRIQ